jgi:hypothetical protein
MTSPSDTDVLVALDELRGRIDTTDVLEPDEYEALCDALDRLESLVGDGLI